MSEVGVYLQCRPDGSPFYVGKGSRERSEVMSKSKRNPYHYNVIQKYGAENVLKGYLECSTDAIAFELEQGVIMCLKRMGIKLTNMTNGGEGFEQGHTPWSKGKPMSESAKQKMIETQKEAYRNGRKSWITGKNHTAETCAKISAARKGKLSNMAGKKHSEETKQKMRKHYVCPHCGTEGGANSMKRWHFDNCTGVKPKFQSRVSVNGTRLHLGRFHTKQEAADNAQEFKELVMSEMAA